MIFQGGDHIKKYLITLTILLACIIVITQVSTGQKASAATANNTFTLEELSKYNGKNGAKAYIALDGRVYDISGAPEFVEGVHVYDTTIVAGTDISEEFKLAPGGHYNPDFMGRYPFVGVLVKSKPQPSPTSNETQKLENTPTPRVQNTPTPFRTSDNVINSPMPSASHALDTNKPEPPKSTEPNESGITKGNIEQTIQNDVINTPSSSLAPENVAHPTPNSDTPSAEMTSGDDDNYNNDTKNGVKVNVKKRLLSRDQVVFLGGVALFFFFLSLCYYPLKRISVQILKVGDQNVNVYMKKIRKMAFNGHIWLGVSSLAIALLHSIGKVGPTKFTVGYVSLGALVLAVLSGIGLRSFARFRVVSTILRYTHILTMPLFIFTLIYHIIDKLF